MPFKSIPVEIIPVVLAVAGGIARYLNGYVNGQRFKLSILFASAGVAGFSGLMFALLGQSLGLHNAMINVMAGVGGFFGEQTLKFLMEYVTKKPTIQVTISNPEQVKTVGGFDNQTPVQ